MRVFGWALVSLLLFSGCSGQESEPSFPTITVSAKFSYPPRLARESIANPAYLDFEQWMDALPEGTNKVGLEIPATLGAWAIDQCTSSLWHVGINEIDLTLIGGGTYRVVIPPRDPTKAIFINGGRGLESSLMMVIHGFGHTIDAFAEYEPGEVLQGCRPIEATELQEMIDNSSKESPIHVHLFTETPLIHLDRVLADLRDLGASEFSLIYLI